MFDDFMRGTMPSIPVPRTSALALADRFADAAARLAARDDAPAMVPGAMTLINQARAFSSTAALGHTIGECGDNRTVEAR